MLANEHVDIDDVRQLASPAGEDSHAQYLQEVRLHLAKCEDCRKRFGEFQDFADVSQDLKVWSQNSAAGECRPREEWENLVAGQLNPTAEGLMLAHAVNCGRCGELLKNALALFSDPTPAEESFLATLRTERPEFQRDLARRMAATQSRPRATRWWWNPPLRIGYAAAILMIAAVALAFWMMRRPSVDKLIAAAYSEHRDLEMRFRGAKYAALGPQKRASSPEEFRLEHPNLFKAEILLGETRQPSNDPTYLQARARLELLRWEPESAKDDLEKALTSRPNLPEIQTDLATAYFELAEKTGNPGDYGEAVEILGRVLRADPNDPIALFNRAIAYEKLFLFPAAIDDWEHYLQLDPRSDWANEARKHKETDERRSGNRGALSPSSATESLLESPPTAVADDRENYVIRGQQLALQNHDTWLADYLLEMNANTAAGVGLLSQCVTANAAGYIELAQESCGAARRAFSTGNAPAARARVELELTYLHHRQLQPAKCVADARAARQAVAQRQYPWIVGQLLLERSTCAAMLSDLDVARADASEAVRIARQSHFSSLELRGIGFLTELQATVGNYREAWNLGLAGLSRFWEERVPLIRGYQLYGALALIPESSGAWQLSTALNRQAVILISQTANVSGEAVARYRLAANEFMNAEPSAGSHDLLVANELFARLPDSSSRGVYRAYASMFVAALQRPENAESLSQLKDVQDFVVRLTYLQFKAEKDLGTGNLDLAETELESAADISEQSLAALKNNRDALAWEQQAGVIYRRLAQLFALRRHDPARALTVWERYLRARTAASIGATVGESRPPPSGLRSDNPHLVFMQLEDGVAMWLRSTHGLRFAFSPVPASLLQRTIAEFHQSCSDPSSDVQSRTALARQLYRWLIAPVASSLEHGSVVELLPDGTISQVPFIALRDDGDRELLESFVFENVGGGGRRNEPAFDVGNAHAVLVSVPNSEAAAGPLRSVSEEIKEIKRLLPSSVVIASENATVANIQAALADAGLFHYGGHTRVVSGRTELLLGDGSAWDVSSLPKGKLGQCRLVVLAACSTSSKSQERVQEMDTPAAQFLRAGAHQVVATNWDIDDEATSSLMVSFYTNLVHGASVATALQSAELAIRREHAHPYYWASFSVYQ